MSGSSSIEWTDATWNPVRGCSRVSEGCRNCYAERFAARNLPEHRSPTTGEPFAERTKAGPRWTGAVELIRSALDWPLRKPKPLRIFVNSMSDLFHERLSDEAIAAVFGVMAACPQHTFQVLTKRPERMVDWFDWIRKNAPRLAARLVAAGANWPRTDTYSAESVLASYFTAKELGEEAMAAAPWPLRNVWLGVSVEDQATADERIPLLLQTPAAKRFVSYEPALGPVNFRRWIGRLCTRCKRDAAICECEFTGRTPREMDGKAARATRWGLDWVIAGGESGPGARPNSITWARSTVEQCRAAGVACFVKQLGARPVEPCPGEVPLPPTAAKWCARCGSPAGTIGTVPLTLKHRKGGDWNEWPEDLRVREFPA